MQMPPLLAHKQGRPSWRHIDVCAAQARAENRGLVFFPDPSKNAYEADVIWSQPVFPAQIEIHSRMKHAVPVSDLRDRLFSGREITIITDVVGREYMLLRWQGQVVQARCAGLSLRGPEPVKLGLSFSHTHDLQNRLKVCKELIAGRRHRQSDMSPLWTKRTQILRNGLFTLDALDQGLSHREIAECLYGVRRIRAEWRSGSYISNIRYLIKKTEALRAGALYEKLLGRKWIRPE